MRLRHLLWVAAVLLVAAAASLLGGCRGKADPNAASTTKAVVTATPVMTMKAQQGTIQDTVNLTGSVEPLEQTDVQSEVSGKVDWVGVQVGDHVAKGQALVKLDTALAAAATRQSEAAEAAAKAQLGQSKVALSLTRDQTAIGVRQAQQGVTEAQTRLKQAETTADLTRSRVEDTISQAKIAVSTAQSHLADVKAGSRKQEIAQAQAKVDQASADLHLAKLNLARQKNLLTSGAVAQAQVDTAQAQYETSEAQLNSAQEGLSLAKAGARTEEVRQAELSVDQAQQALTQAISQRAQTDVADRDVNNAEVALQQAQQNLRLAQADQQKIQSSEEDLKAAGAAVRQATAASNMSSTELRKHVIYAPFAGIIASREVDPGEGALPGVPLLRIVAMNPVRITAEANDVQVHKLRVGQQATVTVDAMPGRQFKGHITDIAPEARQGQRLFSVRVLTDNPDLALKAGMFSRVQIVVAVHRDTTLVPRDALVERGPDRVIYAVSGGKIQVRKVAPGASNDDQVEILRGVKPGDVLVVAGQNLLAEGQKVMPETAAATEAAMKADDYGGQASTQ